MSKRHCIIPIAALLLLLGFFFLTIAAKFDLTQQIDFDLTVKIQDNMPLRLKDNIINIVWLGSWQFMTALVILTMFIFRKQLLIIGILYTLIVAIEVYGKYELQHPPPPQMFTLRFEHLNLPKDYVREASSYPSGHAARTAFFSFIWIAYLLKTTIFKSNKQNDETKEPFTLKLPLGITILKETPQNKITLNYARILASIALSSLLVGFTLLIGISKVYLGEHWTSDVVGGWMLGGSFGLLSQLKPSLTKIKGVFGKKFSDLEKWAKK